MVKKQKQDTVRVVIVGGGFAGVKTALNLANNSDFDVVLVSKQSYFEYHSALYRSATGRSTREVAISLPEFFVNDTNIQIVQDEIIHIDHTRQFVAGFTKAIYSYDVLVLAVGSVTQYFGIKGLSEFSYGVNTLNEALELRNRLHQDLLVHASSERQYIVVGAGPTGTELSGELVTYLRHIRQRHAIKTKFSLRLLEAGPTLLPLLPVGFTDKIYQQVCRLGIKVVFNTAVTSETGNEITVPEGTIQSHVVMWTAGATNNPLYAKHPSLFVLGKGQKVIVNEYLETTSGIYVLGDGALTLYSGMAQTAVYDANFVTDNLKRALKKQVPLKYQPKKPIYAIPAGSHWAAVLWGKMTIYGFAGWILRRLFDLRLYLAFLPLTRAYRVWRSGFVIEETCSICKK